MRARRIGWRSAVTAVSVLALVLPTLTSAGVERHAFATEVHVTFTDRTLFVTPASLSQTGPAMITVANNGHKLHVLTITGPGVKGARTERVSPGGTAVLHMNLLTGSYALSDPAGLGKSKVRRLVVTSNVVGPPVNAQTPKQAPTTATTTTAMDCAL